MSRAISISAACCSEVAEATHVAASAEGLPLLPLMLPVLLLPLLLLLLARRPRGGCATQVSPLRGQRSQGVLPSLSGNVDGGGLIGRQLWIRCDRMTMQRRGTDS